MTSTIDRARSARGAAIFLLTLLLALILAACPTGTDPGGDPGTDPSADPGTDPSADPGTDPGTDPAPDPGSDPYSGSGRIPEACRGIWFESFDVWTEYTWYIMADSIRRVKRNIVFQNYVPVRREVVETLDLGTSLSGTSPSGDAYEITPLASSPVLAITHTVGSSTRELLMNKVPREDRSFTFDLRRWEATTGSSRALVPAAGISLVIQNAFNTADRAAITANGDGSFTASNVAPGDQYKIVVSATGEGTAFAAAPVIPADSGESAGTVTVADEGTPYSFKLARSDLDPGLLRWKVWENFIYQGTAEGEAVLHLLELANTGEGSAPASGLSYEISLPEGGVELDSAFSSTSYFPITITTPTGSISKSLVAADETGSGAVPAYLRLKLWGVDTGGAEYLERTMTIKVTDAASGRFWTDSYSWRVYRESMRLIADGAGASATMQPEGLTAPLTDTTVVPKSLSGSSYLISVSGQDSVYRLGCGSLAPHFATGYWFNNVPEMVAKDRRSLFEGICEAGAGDDTPETASRLEIDSELMAFASAGDMDYYRVAAPTVAVEQADDLDFGPVFEAWRATDPANRFWDPAISPQFTGQTIARSGFDGTLHSATRAGRHARTLDLGWGTALQPKALVYARADSSGWSAPELVLFLGSSADTYTGLSLADLAAGPDGSVHLLYALNSDLYYTARAPGQSVPAYDGSLSSSAAWSSPELVKSLAVPLGSGGLPRIIAASDGSLTVFLPGEEVGNIWKKDSGGSWAVASPPNNWRWLYCDVEPLPGGDFVSVSSPGGASTAIFAERVVLGADEASSIFQISPVGGSSIAGPYHLSASPLDESFTFNWSEPGYGYLLRSIVSGGTRIQFRENATKGESLFALEKGFHAYGDLGGFYQLNQGILLAESRDRPFYRRAADPFEGYAAPSGSGYAAVSILPPLPHEDSEGGAEVSVLNLEISTLSSSSWSLRLIHRRVSW